MRLHLVGGFLGSGKTTAIIQACRLLMLSGKKVGVITNDQGKYLVDSAFVEWSDVPTVDVTGGCFCCNYNALDSRLDTLINKIQPDIVFAESVGSCVDLVATVVNPMRKYGELKVQATSLTVFTDSRLLLRRLKGEDFPFSDAITYIYDKQMEEAGLLMINKVDLLEKEDLQMLEDLSAQRFPLTPRLFCSSLDVEDIREWINLLEKDLGKFAGETLDVDYQQYSSAEQMMVWLDASINISHYSSPDFRQNFIEVVDSILKDLEEKRILIGHVKFLLTSASGRYKISITTLNDPNWITQIPMKLEGLSNILINARAVGQVNDLKTIFFMRFKDSQLGCAVDSYDCFHPGIPNPTFRIIDNI